MEVAHLWLKVAQKKTPSKTAQKSSPKDSKSPNLATLILELLPCLDCYSFSSSWPRNHKLLPSTGQYEQLETFIFILLRWQYISFRVTLP